MGIFGLGQDRTMVAPGGMVRVGQMARTGLPRAVRVALAAIVLLAIIAAAGGWVRAHRPTTLADWQLTGPRSPACIRLVAAPDMSGSMSSLAAARDAALGQVLAWAPKNLRGDDQIAVIEWAETAHVALQPTAIDGSAGATVGHDAVGSSTQFDSVLDALSSLPETRCVTVLAVLSDGLLSSAPQDPETRLRDASVTAMTLVRPSRDGANDLWQQAFPYAAAAYAPATDADATARTIGQVLADATGQKLERR